WHPSKRRENNPIRLKKVRALAIRYFSARAGKPGLPLCNVLLVRSFVFGHLSMFFVVFMDDSAPCPECFCLKLVRVGSSEFVSRRDGPCAVPFFSLLSGPEMFSRTAPRPSLPRRTSTKMPRANDGIEPISRTLPPQINSTFRAAY